MSTHLQAETSYFTYALSAQKSDKRGSARRVMPTAFETNQIAARFFRPNCFAIYNENVIT